MLIVHTLKSQNTINLKFRSYHSLQSLEVIANSLGWNDNEKAGTSIGEFLLLKLWYEKFILLCYAGAVNRMMTEL